MDVKLILAGGLGWPDISSPESLLPCGPKTLISLWPASCTADPHGLSGRCGERFCRPAVQRVQLGETACRRVAPVLVLCAGGRLERQLDHLVCVSMRLLSPASPVNVCNMESFGDRPKGKHPTYFRSLWKES